ncbi:MAG: PD40 domain-containing protein [Chloroflexi bacterium]|nr:PD40 domain-containing protein [Chloroflexota bacterium]OJV89321.1 MAG: hypothetical protein BGO39_35645 [Chloroflexi bacterium 54-19]
MLQIIPAPKSRPAKMTCLGLILLTILNLSLAFIGELPTARADTPHFMTTQGDRLVINGQTVILKGTNFYPLGNSFTAMWMYWDSEAVRQGLQQAAALGDNSVRILVPFSSIYGWTQPGSGYVVPEYLDRLRQFVQLAGEYRLGVIITLFDFEDVSGPGTKEELYHRQYAHDIVTAFKDDDRVIAWDLHNEPDNYGLWNSQDNAEPTLVWLSRMRQYVKSLDPNHLITVGMGKRESFYRQSSEGYTVLDLSDFVSEHSYNADALAEEIYELQGKTNRQKPIVIEEMGWPSGPVFSTDFTEAAQVDKYYKTLEVAKSHNVAGILQWMLYDAEPTGAPPWDDIGSYYGLVKRNGQLKPAAQVWQTNFVADPLPTPVTTTNLALTKAAPKVNPPHYFPATDHYLGTPMYEMWRRGGAELIFGLPLTDAFLQEDVGSGRHDFVNDPVKTPMYQYFEKGRMEYHKERRALPEYSTLQGIDRYLFLIDFGNVGLELAAVRGYNFAPATQLGANSATYQWFTQTSHSLQEPFLSFWQQHLGNYIFGSPISEPFEETNPETGQRRLVQYFEKGRLEYRPEFANTNAAVEVGNVGAELIKAKGWIPKAYSDYQPPAGTTTTSDQIPVAAPTGQGGFADPAFNKVWSRTDAPVANGQTSRTWLWGDKPGQALQESYQEAPGGSRLVQYFDKSRMELTNPGGDASSKWYVTNGLLAKELITGQMQIGDNRFESRSPAQLPLAGDALAVNPDAPTYASLQNLASTSANQPDMTGKPIGQFLLKDGTLGSLPGDLVGKATFGQYNAQTGHNIAAVFWNFLTQTRGPVLENGQTVQGDVVDWLFSVGLPLTEPYWTTAKVAGVEREVLVQAFERRVLTYTPANPAAYQVEMGNVGLHYYTWRYGSATAPASSATSGILSLDTATRTDLDQSGGLAYRQIDSGAFYRYTSRAGEAGSAGLLPGSVNGASQPYEGPGLVYLAPEKAGRQAIFLNDFKGNNRVVAYGLSAALSPDGQTLAYVAYSGFQKTGLFLLDLATGQSRELAQDVTPALAWSNDGARLAFFYNDVNKVRLAVSEGGAPPHVVFITEPDTLAADPTFSKDGGWLVYTLMRLSPDDRGPKVSASEIHALNLASGGDRILAGSAARPVFSPDGANLAVLGWNDPHLYLIGWDEGNAGPKKPLAPALACEMECRNTGSPAWSPDGRWLAFTGPGRNLLGVKGSGGAAYELSTKPVAGGSGGTFDPVWTGQ